MALNRIILEGRKVNLFAMVAGQGLPAALFGGSTPRDALSRLENMVGMAGANLGVRATRQQISSAITVVIQIARLTDGTRKLISVQEINGMEGDTITMQEVFQFKRTGTNAEGKVIGHFCATGVYPQFDQRLKEFGVAVPESTYDPHRIYE